MGKRKELTGQKLGRLLVVECLGVGKDYRLHYRCICDCGNEISTSSKSLLNGDKRSCGCLRTERITNLNKLDQGINARNVTYQQYVIGAKKRGLSFDLTIDQFVNVTQQACHYCGAAPSNETKVQASTGSYTYNGIDRMNNSLGYFMENCIPCCKRCNFAKGTMGYWEFLEFIRSVFYYRVANEEDEYAFVPDKEALKRAA